MVEAEATALETGKRLVLRARFLVGCDGAGSGVRRALGVKLEGSDALVLMTEWNEFKHLDLARVDGVARLEGVAGQDADRIGPEGAEQQRHAGVRDGDPSDAGGHGQSAYAAGAAFLAAHQERHFPLHGGRAQPARIVRFQTEIG